MSESPQQSFEKFLNQSLRDAWISSFTWRTAVTSAELKSQMGALPRGYSRTHKTGPAGVLWALDVQSTAGQVVGVDLELINRERPIMQNPQWLAERFQLTPENYTSQTLLEEWVSREAVFKALSPNNAHLMLSSFHKFDESTYGIIDDPEGRRVEVRVAWTRDWVLALARRFV
ncbi:MAG TPA: 4'-phosphopantetheinyl transferase superfamily protein [Bdellovibrionota bacterium]|nr:4'-phosphopantetheinyl transferase superfamily protein [Bdellovibrionota bacterium]